MLAEICICLAKREIQFHLIVSRQCRQVLGQRQHRGQSRIAGSEALAVSQTAVKFGPPRHQCNRLRESRTSLVKTAELFQNNAKLVACIGVVRLERDRAFVLDGCLVRLRRLLENRPEVVERLGVVRPDRQRRAVLGDGIPMTSLRLQRHSERVVRLGRPGVASEGTADEPHAFRDVAFLDQDQTQIMQCPDMVAIERKHRPILLLGTRMLSGVVQRQCKLKCPFRQSRRLTWRRSRGGGGHIGCCSRLDRAQHNPRLPPPSRSIRFREPLVKWKNSRQIVGKLYSPVFRCRLSKRNQRDNSWHTTCISRCRQYAS